MPVLQITFHLRYASILTIYHNATFRVSGISIYQTISSELNHVAKIFPAIAPHLEPIISQHIVYLPERALSLSITAQVLRLGILRDSKYNRMPYPQTNPLPLRREQSNISTSSDSSKEKSARPTMLSSTLTALRTGIRRFNERMDRLLFV